MTGIWHTRCAWCGVHLQTERTDAFEGEVLSHGMCARCERRFQLEATVARRAREAPDRAIEQSGSSRSGDVEGASR